MARPSSAVRNVINRGLGRVTRRIEIYEADASTLWMGDNDRLIDGSVPVTYGDNERRALDLTLRNDDNLLHPSPHGFWYDKVIKVYRGVSYQPFLAHPAACLIEYTGSSDNAYRFAGLLKMLGLQEIEVDLSPTLNELLEQDVIVSFTGTSASTQGALLQDMYNRGKSILTFSTGNDSSVVPFITSTETKSTSESWGISQPSSPSFLAEGWGSSAVASGTGLAVTGVAAGATVVSRWTMANSTSSITATANTNASGGKWLDIHLPGVGSSTDLRTLIANGVRWFRNLLDEDGIVEWETQVGEFVIDGINEDYFPTAAKITGRDYTKRMMSSKIPSAVTFDSTTTLRQLAVAMAGNSGIRKTRFAEMPETLSTESSFDRGTPRWDILRDAVSAQGYELFFDAEGYLTTRKYLDPTLSAPSEQFLTGPDGNLAALGRGVNDSRIYNHIYVYGDPTSEETRMPYVGEAVNRRSDSPTSVDKIGDRYYSFASTFFTSQQQCQEYAERLLSQHALESYELNFSFISYPWMDVGEIARVIDPRATIADPDKFLIDGLTIPLGLGPMSGSAKRVTMVG